MIYSHWSLAPWDAKRWPNFAPHEFASNDNGQLYWWPEFFDKCQALRTAIGKPIYINSAHRSWRYNLAIGGAVRSEHKRIAIDVDLTGHNRFHILAAARAVGFKGFGYYSNFIHLDLGLKRFWHGKGAKPFWAVNDNKRRTSKQTKGLKVA